MPILQQTKSGQFVLTIPKETVMLKGWKKGALILISNDKDGNIVLREQKAE